MQVTYAVMFLTLISQHIDLAELFINHLQKLLDIVESF